MSWAHNSFGDKWFNWYDEPQTIKEADEYINSLNGLKVYDYQKDDDGYCVLIGVRWKKQRFWVDLWDRDRYGEFHIDWNESIFMEDNYRDMLRKRIMDDSDFASYAFSLAEDYVIEKDHLKPTYEYD